MRVAAEVDELARRLQVVRATPCAECGHPFHLHHDRCDYPLWPKPGTTRCRCRKFVDPSNVLSLTARRSAP